MLFHRNYGKPCLLRKVYKQRPAGAFHRRRSSRKLLHKGLKTAKVTFNLIGQPPFRMSAAMGGHAFPIKSVQHMSRPVKSQFPFPVLYKGKVLLLPCFLQFVQRIVQPVHVTVMVHVVVNPDRLLVHMRLQCIIWIGQVG
jgi:hypothetical protein